VSDSGLYWRGVIRRLPTGHTIYLHALRSTAEFFGWDEAFDQYRPDVALPARPDGHVSIQPINRSGARGGRRLQISRTETKSNRVGCVVNVFRIAKAATYADLRAVARATRGEWFWMTDFRGRRRSASEYLDHF
jgi:hypothetical protein